MNSSNKLNHSGNNICFDPAVFLKESFSIDDFLRNHRNKATLEVLRNDLGIYLKDLRLAMIELINKDYEDFVNLSKDLVGLNSGIEVLQNPLENVKSEVNVVKTSLHETIDGMTVCIQHADHLKKKKQGLHHLSQVILSLKKLQDLLHEVNKSTATTSLEFIERAVSEYTFLHYATSKCKGIISVAQRNECDSVGSILMDLLKNSFLAGICEQNPGNINRCLRMFASLDKVQEAEKLLQVEVIVPYLYDLVNESSLKKEPNGLKGLFQKIVYFMDTQLKFLLSPVDEFNFLTNSLWVELAKRLELHTSSIFSAGDPETFHGRYTDTMRFVNTMRKRCNSQNQLAIFNAHPQTVHFLSKWNLLVYFKIRFQEIAGQLESTLSEGLQLAWEGSVYHYNATAVAKLCLERCWDENIFIVELMPAFWRLCLQISARYGVFVKEETNKDASPPESNEGLPYNNACLKKLIFLHTDTTKLACDGREILDTARERHASANEGQVMATGLEECQQLLSALQLISDRIVNSLVESSILHLASVKDIPRLFRRTNRDIPTKPCDYVSHITEPISLFHVSYRSTVTKNILASWLTAALDQVSRNYYTSVCEVLDNAQKTEQSLRRLKKAKDKFAASVEQKGPSDDDKIRQQLVVDVRFYCQRVKDICLESECLPILTEMIEMVEKAKEMSEKQ